MKDAIASGNLVLEGASGDVSQALKQRVYGN